VIFFPVECYDRRKDEWTPQPSLNCEKGCLSGVSIAGKIFMLGGKNWSEYFSEVDMLDPVLGKWINFIPMLEKVSDTLFFYIRLYSYMTLKKE
jgi:hypothetical protein